MKNTFILSGLSVLCLLSCKKESDITNIHTTPVTSPYMRYSGSDYSQHIPIDSADKMVASYVASINTSTEIRSLTFNADSMRNYLSNSQIATLKFSLAHQASYIDADNFGVNAGTSASALTFILSALDEEDDDYIYTPGNKVYDLKTSQRVSIADANNMIQSYLTSISYPDNNTNLRSMTFDADTMRNFLNNSAVVNLKFIVAHRDSYINSGKYGTYCGTNATGFTFVILGLNSSNQIIYTSNNMVMEHTRPCPTFCSNGALLTTPI